MPGTPSYMAPEMFRGAEADERTEVYALAVTLYQYPHEFSGGMRQRAVIAMALVCRPELLIADEPTTSLDVTIQAQIIGLIKTLQREIGCSVLLITHDFGVVAQMADDVAVMRSGEIVERGTVRAVLKTPQHAYTRSLLDALPSRRAAAFRKVASERLGARVTAIDRVAGSNEVGRIA
jgi:ABC-type dipeptide/oligopeptide/nickel transport system ATPase component